MSLDNETAAPNNSNIILTFSEKVDAETGNITIHKKSDDSVVEAIDVTNTTLVSGTGTNKITINPTNDLDLGTEYYIKIDATAFDDAASNSFAGITIPRFLQNFIFWFVPSLVEANPADDATSASHLSNIELTFWNSKCRFRNITIYRKSDDSVIEEIDITSSLVTGTGTTKSQNQSAELESERNIMFRLIHSISWFIALRMLAYQIKCLSFTTSPYLFTSTSDDRCQYRARLNLILIWALDLWLKNKFFRWRDFSGKYYNVKIVYTASINDAAKDNVTLNSRSLDFQLTTQVSNSIVVFDKDLVANSLVITDSSNQRDETIYWTYYSISDTGAITTLHYDPIKDAGAKFFDTSVMALQIQFILNLLMEVVEIRMA